MRWSEGEVEKVDKKEEELFLNKRRKRCHWLIELWSIPIGDCVNGHGTIQLVPSCGLNTKRELIYTHSINKNIESIIRSVELKTPIVSPMDCVDSPGASHRNMLHLLAASNPVGRILSHLPCSQLVPLWPVLHTQLPATHNPCPPHWGSIHWEAGTSHSVPFQPL